MKKFLSFLLAAFMLAGAFCMNAAAEPVVGTHGQNGDASDGVADIPEDASASGDVVLNLGAVEHRYAVDVTFPTMTFDVGGLTWNVQTLQYDIGGTAMTDQTLDITVTNYSDLPVAATGSVGPLSADAASAGISLVMTKQSVTVAKVTAGADAQPVEETLTAALTSGDWTASVNALVAVGKSGNIAVGTITVAIDKAP